MIRLFSRFIDYGVELQFKKDSSGRLVFLPYGSRGKAYFIDTTADEEKTRSFVKLYRSASTLMGWLGMLAIYAYGWSFTSYLGASPLRNRLMAFVVSSLVYILIMVGFIWVLWAVYKETVPTLTASLSEAGPDVKGQLTTSAQQRSVKRLALGVLLVAAGILVVIVLLTVRK